MLSRSVVSGMPDAAAIAGRRHRRMVADVGDKREQVGRHAGGLELALDELADVVRGDGRLEEELAVGHTVVCK